MRRRGGAGLADGEPIRADQRPPVWLFISASGPGGRGGSALGRAGSFGLEWDQVRRVGRLLSPGWGPPLFHPI